MIPDSTPSARASRAAQAWSMIWAVVSALLGAWSAVLLAASPLLGSPTLVQVLAGIAGAVPMALYWGLHARAVRLGQRRTAKSLRAWFGGVVGAILGVVGAAFLISGWGHGMFGPLGRDRLQAYDRLGRLMARTYPFFEQKGLDWPALLAEHRPAVAAAESDAAYAEALGWLLLELQDAHTGVTTPWADVRCCFALVEEIEGQAVVTQAGPAAVETGLERGSVLHSVDGLPIDEALERVHPWLRNGSTPWQRRYRAFRYLLSSSSQADGLTVTFEDPAGELRDVSLAWEAASSGQSGGSDGPVITGQRLAGAVGLIRIPTLSAAAGRDLVAEFDAALAGLLDAPALILDLRGNGGGDSRLGDRMVGRLLDEPVRYGAFDFAARMPQHFWMRRFPLRAVPRGATYDGPVVVLIDTRVMSSGEDMLTALLARGGVTTVGRRTGGASGNPVIVRMPGNVRLRYSTGIGSAADGQPIEGRGYQPHLPVAWTIADVRQGRDADIVAALAHLLGAPAAD